MPHRHLRYNRGKCETETNCVLKVPPLQCGEDGDLMANDLLMLFKLDADTIAFLSLIASAVGVVMGSISAVAALFAALVIQTILNTG